MDHLLGQTNWPLYRCSHCREVAVIGSATVHNSQVTKKQVVIISRQPAHFTGYFEYCAPVTPNVSRSVLSVILEK